MVKFPFVLNHASTEKMSEAEKFKEETLPMSTKSSSPSKFKTVSHSSLGNVWALRFKQVSPAKKAVQVIVSSCFSCF